MPMSEGYKRAKHFDASLKDFKFNAKIAQEFSIKEAIFCELLKELIVKQNYANNQTHDGLHWASLSLKKFWDRLPFFTKSGIVAIIQSLCDKGVILKERYIFDKADPACCFAFVDEDSFGVTEGLEEARNRIRPGAQIVK